MYAERAAFENIKIYFFFLIFDVRLLQLIVSSHC